MLDQYCTRRTICICVCRIVLYCSVSYCIVLYRIVSYCIVLYCIVLYCFVLFCFVAANQAASQTGRHTYIRTYVHTHIHIHMHTHAHVHTYSTPYCRYKKSCLHLHCVCHCLGVMTPKGAAPAPSRRSRNVSVRLPQALATTIFSDLGVSQKLLLPLQKTTFPTQLSIFFLGCGGFHSFLEFVWDMLKVWCCS